MRYNSIKNAPRVYVGTWAKCNAGNLFGKWLDLEDYEDADEFRAACEELHADEEEPEFMFQDWENNLGGLITEDEVSDIIWDLLDAMHEMSDTEQDAFITYLNEVIGRYACDADGLVRAFNAAYVGEYDSLEDYAEDTFFEVYPEVPENIRHYIDLKAYARNLDRGGYCEANGHIFRPA